jgi:hypothetical protein
MSVVLHHDVESGVLDWAHLLGLSGGSELGFTGRLVGSSLLEQSLGDGDVLEESAMYDHGLTAPIHPSPIMTHIGGRDTSRCQREQLPAQHTHLVEGAILPFNLKDEKREPIANSRAVAISPKLLKRRI